MGQLTACQVRYHSRRGTLREEDTCHFCPCPLSPWRAQCPQLLLTNGKSATRGPRRSGLPCLRCAVQKGKGKAGGRGEMGGMEIEVWGQGDLRDSISVNLVSGVQRGVCVEAGAGGGICPRPRGSKPENLWTNQNSHAHCHEAATKSGT